MRVGELIEWAEGRLKASAAIDHWQAGRELAEAEELLLFVLDRQDLDRDEAVAESEDRRFRRLVDRRATGEPVPYIKGFSEFRGLRLRTRAGVFVPRDSSEFLAAQAVRRLLRRRDPILVDLATGSGPVALAVANEVPGAEVLGVDVSADAVTLARRNARALGLSATFLVGDLFAPLPGRMRGRVGVVTVHPPYVGRREMRELPDEVRKFEPIHTLTDGSPHGLGLVERAAAGSVEWLRPGGWLLIEVSPDKSRAASTLLRGAGLRDVRSTKGGPLKVTRVVVGRS
jgi:release factor glutamine methyltransferase